MSFVFVIIGHIVFGRWTRPIGMVSIFHLIAFGITLAAFIVALTHEPYVSCGTSDYQGCEMLKAAIGIDGVLW